MRISISNIAWSPDADATVAALLFGTQGLNLFGEPAIRDQMLNHLRRVCRIAQGLGDSGTDHGPINAAIRRYCPDRIVTIEMLEDKTAPIDAIDRALVFANRTYADAAGE